MLEIIALFALCKFIGDLAKKKGQNKILFMILLGVAWIGGEIIGFIFGMIIIGVGEKFNPLIYLCAIATALAAVVFVFIILAMMPTKQQIYHQDQRSKRSPQRLKKKN